MVKNWKSLFFLLDGSFGFAILVSFIDLSLRETDANTIQIYRVTLAARSHQIYLLLISKVLTKSPKPFETNLKCMTNTPIITIYINFRH